MKLKKYTGIIGAIIGTLAVTTAFGFVIDRPTWYRADFLPVADVVTELAAESVSSKLQRAEEQVDRREGYHDKARSRGQKIDAESNEDLRHWKARVRELKRKLKRLDK